MVRIALEKNPAPAAPLLKALIHLPPHLSVIFLTSLPALEIYNPMSLNCFTFLKVDKLSHLPGLNHTVHYTQDIPYSHSSHGCPSLAVLSCWKLS